MKILIVIPTYWTLLKEIKESAFDHPTSYKGKNTLKRCLKSMQDSGIKEEIMVFPSPTNEVIERKVQKIISSFDKLNVQMFTSSHLKHITGVLNKKSFSKEFISHFNMNSYPNIRNMCFVIAALKKADLVIQIDDDEVIEDKRFIEKAFDSIGENVFGKKLWGKTGFYVNKKGKWKLRQQNPEIRELWPKETYINKAFQPRIQSNKRLTKTTVALGGNMVVHRKLFKKVPYDPYNTRGEDVDYLINCKYFRQNFLFDNKLKVKHLPPKRIAPYWIKIRQDIYRFVYLRKKLKFFKIDIPSLDPYPGVFLRKDLERMIMATCANYTKVCLDKKHFLDAKEWNRTHTEILKEAKRRAKEFEGKYIDFQKNWKRLMKILKRIKISETLRLQ